MDDDIVKTVDGNFDLLLFNGAETEHSGSWSNVKINDIEVLASAAGGGAVRMSDNDQDSALTFRLNSDASDIKCLVSTSDRGFLLAGNEPQEFIVMPEYMWFSIVVSQYACLFTISITVLS